MRRGVGMRKIYLIGVIILMILTTGCTKDSVSSGAHKECIAGKIIEVRDNNEILIEITEERGGYKKEDIVLIGYYEYIWRDPEDPDANTHYDTPRLNDYVSVGYWSYEVEEKDGYDYIPKQQVEKFQRIISGKVIEIRDDKEILLKVAKNYEEYKEGDIILLQYSSYYWINPDDINATKHDDTPEYNDNIEFGYWQENVGEKDGYVFLSDIYVQNYPDSYETE